MLGSIAKSRWFYGAAAAMAGALAFFACFGLSALQWDHLDWLVRDDHAQSLMGWLYFRESSWASPLGSIASYNFPIGSSIAFNDTFPWFAVLMKLVSPLLPAKAQIVGLWMLLNFVLQGVFGFALLRALGMRALTALAGACFFVTSPVFLFRFDVGHASLCAHWCVLAALWMAVKRPQGDASIAGWMLLLFLAWSSHPYLGAMVLPIALVSSGRSLRGIAVRGGAMLLASLAAIYTFGYLAPGSSKADEGFHYFSSDILAFFNPHDRSALFRGPTKAGQYEGFAWLGAGICLLLLVVLFDLFGRRESLLARLRKSPHRNLIVVCALMGLFALGSDVRIWGFWIIPLEWFYEPLSFLTGPFRSAGRFIWPLYYLVVAGVLAAIQRHRIFGAGVAAMAILFVSFALQVFDQYPVITSWQRVGRTAEFIELAAPEWQMLGQDFRHIALVPPHFENQICGDDAVSYHTTYYAPFALVAWEQGMTINSGPRARPPRAEETRYCRELMSQLKRGEIESDTVYVVEKKISSQFQAWTADSAQCNQIDGQMVCVSKKKSLALRPGRRRG